MCEECYRMYNSPIVVNDDVIRVAAMIRQFQDNGMFDAGMHSVTEDWNIEDDTIMFYLNKQLHTSSIGKNILVAMKHMSIDERATALAIVDRFITV